MVAFADVRSSNSTISLALCNLTRNSAGRVDSGCITSCWVFCVCANHLLCFAVENLGEDGGGVYAYVRGLNSSISISRCAVNENFAGYGPC